MPSKIAPQQGDTGALHGNVRSRAHGDAHIGGRERWRVIHPVARHRHDAPLALEPRHHIGLPVGQHIGFDFA